MRIKITFSTGKNKTDCIIFDRSGMTIIVAIVEVVDLGYCSLSAILKVEKLIEN